MVMNYLMIADDICVFGPSISGLQCLLTIGIFVSPKKYKQPATSNIFHCVRVQFSEQINCLGVLLYARLKDNDEIQRQVKSVYCAANKLRDTFAQCSPAVSNTLFRPYCMRMHACQ